jgi:hypothetical protein
MKLSEITMIKCISCKSDKLGNCHKKCIECEDIYKSRYNCEHNKSKYLCKECKVICKHNKQIYLCKNCKSIVICEYNMNKSQCKYCNLDSILKDKVMTRLNEIISSQEQSIDLLNYSLEEYKIYLKIKLISEWNWDKFDFVNI